MTEAENKAPRRGCRGLLARGFKGFIVLLAVLLSVGAVYQAAGQAADRRAYKPAGELIDMGGFTLHLHCEGTGSPTVLLVAGAGDIGAIWEPVQLGLQEQTRVCSYDRPGLGWSDFAPGEQSIESQMTLLHNLLQTAEEPGPYIVVGHSIGGVMARTFAAAYPDETAGVVLVDSSVEGQFAALPDEISDSNEAAALVFSACRLVQPFGLIRLLGLGNARAASFDLLSEDAQKAVAATFHQTRGCRALQLDGAVADDVLESGTPFDPSLLGDTPLIVITRGLAEQDAEPGRYSSRQIALFDETQEIWLELQAGLLNLSSESRQVIARRSGHYVHTTEPDVVIEAVQSLLGEGA